MRTSSYKNLRHRKNTIKKNNQRRQIAKQMDNVYACHYYFSASDTSDKPRVQRGYSSRRAGSYKSNLKKIATRMCRRAKDIAMIGRNYKKIFDVYWNFY